VKVYESAFAVAINDHPLSLDSARHKSHDRVIANTGRARRSGVQWSYWPTVGAQEALRDAGTDITVPDDVSLVCARYPHGELVIATVEVDPKVEP
jgi:hypothetical protein